MLSVVDLYFDYFYQTIFEQISLTVNPGELLHLRGPNGSGKTTLLKLIAGFFPPLSGSIVYQGSSIHEDAEYSSKIAYVGHKPGFNQLLTAAEQFDFEAAINDINFVNTSFTDPNRSHLPGFSLSEGQRRRISLQRLLHQKASLWLLDEPYVALDDEGQETLNQVIADHLLQGGQVVLSSHQNFESPGFKTKEFNL